MSYFSNGTGDEVEEQKNAIRACLRVPYTYARRSQLLIKEKKKKKSIHLQNVGVEMKNFTQTGHTCG